MLLAREAIAVNPHDALARAVSAAAQARRGNHAAAAAELKLALEADPTNANVLYQAAIVANVRGDRDAALGWLQRAIASGYATRTAMRETEIVQYQNCARL